MYKQVVYSLNILSSFSATFAFSHGASMEVSMFCLFQTTMTQLLNEFSFLVY